jgi:hypothetical protein
MHYTTIAAQSAVVSLPYAGIFCSPMTCGERERERVGNCPQTKPSEAIEAAEEANVKTFVGQSIMFRQTRSLEVVYTAAGYQQWHYIN